MQTSIEWLQQKYDNCPESFLIDEDFEKAKQMHRQEIIDAYFQCGKDNFEHIKVINKSATEYYQETFKKD
jgi:hypothetical protein